MSDYEYESSKGVLGHQFAGVSAGNSFTAEDNPKMVADVLELVDAKVSGTDYMVENLVTAVEYTRKGRFEIGKIGVENKNVHETDDLFIVVEYRIEGHSPLGKKLRGMVQNDVLASQKAELDARAAVLQEQKAQLELALLQNQQSKAALEAQAEKNIRASKMKKRLRGEFLKDLLKDEGGDEDGNRTVKGFRLVDVTEDGFDDHDIPQYKLAVRQLSTGHVYYFTFQRTSEGYNSFDERTFVEGYTE